MDMQKPTSLKDFRTWPVDLQKEYLQKYIAEFGCTQVDLAQLFHTSPANMRHHLREIGFDRSCFKSGGRMTPANRQRFRAWLATYRPDFQTGQPNTAAHCDTAGTTALPPCDDPVELGTDQTMTVSRISCDFTGALDVEQILQMLAPFTNGRAVKMRVVVEEVVV